MKERLAALRMLFDWMVVGQVMPVNSAHAVRGSKHTQRRGKTPVLAANEALPGLRDRALIGLILYTFARVGDEFTQTPFHWNSVQIWQLDTNSESI